MTRRITLPLIDWATLEGREAVIPVKVNWAELRLSPDQILANATARMAGLDEPYPDHSIFDVVIPRPRP